MNEYIKTDPWRIVEEGFRPERVKAAESLFSIGNGALGGRANFEEAYSGPSLQGNYIGGVYYPDKTRVGWWKNGYPEYFAKVLNSAFWPGIGVRVGGVVIDLAKLKVVDFVRVLEMRRGVLERTFTVEVPGTGRVRIASTRFVSMARTELGAVRYSVTPMDSDASVEFTPFIDADVRNEDANYNEKFWEFVAATPRSVTMRTLKTGFEVCHAMENSLDGATFANHTAGEMVAERATVDVKKGATATLHKYVAICSSLNHAPGELAKAAEKTAAEARNTGFDALLEEQYAAWAEKWATCDITIEGDEAAQQGIRYCIFMLLQTYTGRDSRLNIGPKGFTGEKYGGSTYWDTEAYCIPFYLATQGPEVARQLLVYRHNQLDRAIENAAKLGFTGGAALYPMVTMNGQESHNEWEITFEEIHRNGSIAFAIFNYIRCTGDKGYLATHGLEVLIAIARFWAQRATFSAEKNKWVILGVTGPNEYENNVNNNWFTNYIARWCMEYAIEAAEWVRTNAPEDWARVTAGRGFDLDTESAAWRPVIDGMHLPEEPSLGIFLQQDGYMDKEQILVRDLDPAHRPLNQKWSWDRILRSCFIKQADVLQGLYYFYDRFDRATIERNFRFYEARTVHESSLSPCVHSILAARIGDVDKAYEMYLRAARLDLDDYNRENEEGCHITSMAGSWLSVVEGFGGMRVEGDSLTFHPVLPLNWKSLGFKVIHRGTVTSVRIDHDGIEIIPNKE
jgi:maltose phosphorylase